MQSLASSFTGVFILYRDGAQKEIMPNGIRTGWKITTRHGSIFIKQNLGTGLTMISQMISRQNCSILMTGPNYLKGQERSILYLRRNIMMGLRYGPVKNRTGIGGLN